MADSLVSRTRAKMRYYRKGLPWYAFAVRLSIDALSQAGLRIEPYHLYLDGLAEATRPDGPFEKYDFGFMGTEDMREIALIPGRNFTRDALLARLNLGKRCVGIKHEGRTAAFSWCDFTACLFEDGRLFPLRDDEAYIFDAYTLEAFRGRGLAPFMHYRRSQELAKIGRTRCFSVTLLFNVPAVRLKKKLNSKVIELWVLIEVFRRWRFHRRLKTYPMAVASPTRSDDFRGQR